jgi:hypothetical protein
MATKEASMRIDMVKVKEEGKEDFFVCGYNAAYAPSSDLQAHHSYDGYTLNCFSSREGAEKYYQDFEPNNTLQYCGIRRVLCNVRPQEIVSFDFLKIKDKEQIKKIRRRVEDTLRKLPPSGYGKLLFIAEFISVNIDID